MQSKVMITGVTPMESILAYSEHMSVKKQCLFTGSVLPIKNARDGTVTLRF